MKSHAAFGLFAVAVAIMSSAVPTASIAAEPNAKGIEFFEKHIRPVLTQHCFKCHAQTATKIKGELLLDTREAALQGGKTGPAVVPGSIDESLIVSALRHEDFEMPPGKKLPDDVVAKFEQWIEMGAPDPRDGQAKIVGKRDIDMEEGRKFWAFQPPQKVAPPPVKNAAWPRGDIDRFVLAGLETHDLSPALDAEPRELVRRLYFDIIGLPPSPAEIEKWTTQLTSADGIDQTALAQLLDELLASPRFGERWGRHWLDIARYADSNGNVDNVPFPEAWRYRNYVIDAFNADRPYDRFLTEQLAGDLLAYENPQQRNELLVATGFLAIGSKPRPQNNPNYQMDVVAEQIEVTTSAMLGLTVACARCHDHKFDPIPTSEYYALAGIFTSSRAYYGDGAGKGGDKRQAPGGLISLLAESGDDAQAAAEQLRAQGQLAARQRELTSELVRLGVSTESIEGKNKQQIKQQQKANKKQLAKLEARLAKLKAQGDNKKALRAESEIARLRANVGDDEKSGDSEPNVDKAHVKSLRSELAKVDEEFAAITAKINGDNQAMGVLEDRRPADCAICLAGESTDRGPVVPRGFVSVATLGEAPPIDAQQSGRLQLAEWIASKNHPLTARVMVNRIWQHLVGRGIVQSVDNFGEMGERPTHPELLDHLAVQFMEDGWSVKQMIRTIALTRTYQLSSAHHDGNYAADPDNVWLWRASPQRLDAEAFRDAILAFSGKLDLNRPVGSAKLPTYNKKETPKAPEIGSHRSVYLPIIRNGEPEALTLFDFADPSIVVGQREETTVPSQSLYLLNSPFVVQHARAAAERLLADDAARMSDAERVDYAYLLAFGRKPTNEQHDRALAYLESSLRVIDDDNESEKEREKNNRSGEQISQQRTTAWAKFCQSLIAAAEFRYLD